MIMIISTKTGSGHTGETHALKQDRCLLRCTAALAEGLVVTGAQTVCEAAGGGGKLLRLLRHLVLKLTILPGQARDIHSESTQKKTGFCRQVHVCAGGG